MVFKFGNIAAKLHSVFKQSAGTAAFRRSRTYRRYHQGRGRSGHNRYLDRFNRHRIRGLGDIGAAREVGARGIRILRASNSSYKPLPMAGAQGEEVIVNSDY